MYADNVLLEPVCAFDIRIPSDLYGSIQGDLARIQADCEIPVYQEDTVIITGTCIYARFLPFQEQFSMRTHGTGSLRVHLDHEDPCHNTEQVVAEFQYQPLADDTPNSVFCSHGAGFTVNWDHVRDFAHLADPDPETLIHETILD
jgi:translation elongation factor EF-G